MVFSAATFTACTVPRFAGDSENASLAMIKFLFTNLYFDCISYYTIVISNFLILLSHCYVFVFLLRYKILNYLSHYNILQATVLNDSVLNISKHEMKLSSQ